jgi:hypothetical protein
MRRLEYQTSYENLQLLSDRGFVIEVFLVPNPSSIMIWKYVVIDFEDVAFLTKYYS